MRFATLIIDMQVDFFAHERLSRRRATLTHRVNSLVKMCRESDVPIVWVKQEFAPDMHDAMLEAKKKGIRIVTAGTPGAAFLPQLHYHQTDHVVVKKRYSAFFGTTLDELLVRLKPAQLIIAGINTHACIRTTVIDAYQRDYEVILARDCIESHDAEHHEISWKYMDGKLARGMSNFEIGSALARASDINTEPQD